MKHFLYHTTPKENVESVLKNGLKRKGFAVYCSEKPYSWWKPDLAILKIRLTGLKHPMTTFLPHSDEILIWGDINPERISLCNPTDVMTVKMFRQICSNYKSN